jgi:predicted metal-dependent phosphotriesterase family hydrolase
MAVDQDRKFIHERLVKRLVSGDGTTSPEDRVRAFNHADLTEPLEMLLAEVATGAGHVTDEAIDRAKMAGFTEDQIFELVVCAAVGAATRQYESGLTALAHTRSNLPDG